MLHWHLLPAVLLAAVLVVDIESSEFTTEIFRHEIFVVFNPGELVDLTEGFHGSEAVKGTLVLAMDNDGQEPEEDRNCS